MFDDLTCPNRQIFTERLLQLIWEITHRFKRIGPVMEKPFLNLRSTISWLFTSGEPQFELIAADVEYVVHGNSFCKSPVAAAVRNAPRSSYTASEMYFTTQL